MGEYRTNARISFPVKAVSRDAQIRSTADPGLDREVHMYVWMHTEHRDVGHRFDCVFRHARKRRRAAFGNPAAAGNRRVTTRRSAPPHYPAAAPMLPGA